MTEKNELFPNALEAFVIVMALCMTECFIGAVAYDLRDTMALPWDAVGAIVMVLGSGVIFTVLMQYKALTYRALFHASPSSMGAMAMVLMPAIALTVPGLALVSSTLVNGVAGLVPMSAWEAARFAEQKSGSLAALVYGCILAPVLEEMLFRGIILRSFLRQYTKWGAIIGSAVLFGFAHLNIYQFVAGLLCGLYLGWLYERTKSLLPCIGLHMTSNTMVLCLMADEGSASGAWWLMALLLGAAGAFWLQNALVGPVVRSR